MTRLEKMKKLKAYVRLCRMRGVKVFSTADAVRYATGAFFTRRGARQSLALNREWDGFLASLTGKIARSGTVFCRDDHKKIGRTTLWQIV